MFDDNRIVLIKKVINQHLPQSKIYLFGSYAKNSQTKESDFDILVVTNQSLNQKDSFIYKSLFRKLFAKEKIDVDILIESYHNAIEKAKLPGHIVQSAINEGVIL